MGSSCPFPFLSDGMFVFLSKEDCKMREHCIGKKEQRSRMLGIRSSRKGSSYPCPYSSFPSGGKSCCMHTQMMVLRRKVQALRSCQLVLRNCQQEHCILGREQHNQQMVLHSLKRGLHNLRKELHMILLERSSEVQHIHRYSRTCTSCPSPCSSSPWCGRFCRRHSHTEVLRTQGR